MREIKFRGLRTDGKGWVYGCYTHTNKKMNPCIHAGVIEVYEVVPESVGQNSPFNDCKGIQIFDGDIIGDWTECDGEMVQSKFQVYFDDMLGQWMLDCSVKQDKTLSYSLFQELNDFEYEIIGNIHENPEIIKRYNESV